MKQNRVAGIVPKCRMRRELSAIDEVFTNIGIGRDDLRRLRKVVTKATCVAAPKE